VVSEKQSEHESIRGKLMRVVLITTAAAVFVAGLAMLTRDLTVNRLSWAQDLGNQATIIGLATTPALAFDDHAAAERYLTALRARPRILMAALYDSDGRLYASYAKNPQFVPSPQVPVIDGARISGQQVEIVQPIVRGAESLGSLYIRGQYDVMSRVTAYIGIFGLVMALSLFVAYLLSRRLQRVITEPLEAMTQAAREIVERRDYSLRARKISNDEFGLVADAFNNMLDEVQTRAVAREQANTELQKQIEVREKAEEALRDADRRKDEFLATLAHELRNPLTPIRHAVKLMDGDGANETQRQWARDVIARQLQRMALMLDDLLEVSRITQGRLELKTEVTDLGAIVNTAVETARPLIEAKHQELSISLPARPVSIAVDPLRISQSISNLLTNAAKYTDANGNISLSVELLPQEIAISVKDDGIGLEPQAIPHLFEMFSQIKSAIDRSEGGLGIGLALVKGMIQLHGGWVEATSPGAGRGSQFTIHLPRALIVETAQNAAQVRLQNARPGVRRTVLVADDNRDAADTLALLLDMDGYETAVAHGGLQALDDIRRSRPDAAILDIGMPDLNGYEVARRIREEEGGRNMFLLAITGWGHPDDVARAKLAGFDEHLTKPVDAENVVRLLVKYLAD
jgi:signal transduction histidine kinase/ActR/RegA family two-component response regulator